MTVMTACAACGGELPDAARFCPHCAAPVQVQPVGGERKLATVVFADLVGSTQLGEQDPERTRLLLERFYDAMASEIVETGGTVEKFAGDAVMAVFGAPVALEDHAERALHASLSMLRRLTDMFGDRLRLRIGVNTGEVVVGRPREGSSFVTGDAVNVAARLEQAAEAGQVLVGSRTVASVGEAFDFEPARQVDAKGKAEPVVCRRLLRAVAVARPRGVRGLHAAFVGRDSELDLLRATYRRVYAERRPHLVTISADPGVGKSRLVREFGAWLDTEDPAPVRRVGRCLAYGSGITYWALGEILKEHLGLFDTDPADVVRRSLGAHEMLALTLGLDVTADLHPLVARERLQEAWVAFVEELVAAQPAVILVEDVHWAQDPLLEVLERLVRDVSGPLLLVVTTRPEFLDTRPSWGHGRNAATIWLEPLTPEATEQMCHQLLGTDLPAAVHDRVVEAAEGNPFYVEELIGSLIDRGVLVRVDGTWSAAGLTVDLVPPDPVQSILAARIDLLPAAEKSSLQVASVIGRVFWDGPVRDLLDGQDADYVLLEERDFLRRRGTSAMPGCREYAIKHALTREVAYASLPKGRRAHLHAGFARWLVRTVGDQEELAGLVAHHFARAAHPEDADIAWVDSPDELADLRVQAVAWLRRAAAGATARYLLDDALGMLHQALDLADDTDVQGEIWQQVGAANAAKYDGTAFWTAMQRALELVPVERHAPIYADLAYFTSTQAGMWTSLPEATMVLGWADRVLELTDEPVLLAKAQLAFNRWLSEPADQRTASARAVELAEAGGDDHVRALAYIFDADTALGGWDLDHHGRRTRQALAMVDRLLDPDVSAAVFVSAGEHDLLTGDVGGALARTLQHRELVHPLTSHHRVHGVGFLVLVHDELGGWDAVSSLTPEVETLVAANLGTPCMLNELSLLTCAFAAVVRGEPGEAARLRAAAESLGMTGYARIDVARARLALATGDPSGARAALARHDPQVLGGLGPPTITTYLDLLVDLGDAARAEELAARMADACAYSRPFGLRALGRVRGDDSLVREAAGLFEALGLRWHADQTRAALS